MNWLISHVWNIIVGIIIALVGYFSPVKDVIHVMCAAIIFDLFTGLWASRIKGKGWKSIKMWRTIYKLFISTVVVMLLYGMDKEMGITVFKMHKLVAWLITGFEIWSILENAAQVSNLKLFVILRKFMQDRLKEQTGINIKKENDEHN